MSLPPRPSRQPDDPNDTPQQRRLLSVVVILAVAVALAFIFRDRLQQLAPVSIERILYLVMAAMLVGGGLWARGGGSGLGPNWLRNVLLWVALFGAVTLVASVFGHFDGYRGP